MKLGIVVVYLFDCNTEFLFDLHISCIKKYTVSPYVIYGSVGRLEAQWRQKLSNYPEIHQCQIPPTELRGSAEHSYYLEWLTEIAFQEGATHVATLHLDSFPVYMGWDRILESITAQSKTCVAADRSYTACLFFEKDFYFRYRPTFNFMNETSEYLEFLKEWKLLNHSGTSYLYSCYKNHLDWHLLKEISRKPFTCFGHLCGGLIFHFEAGIRLSPGKGLSEEMPLEKVRSKTPPFILFLRKIPFLRTIWLWGSKRLPKRMLYLLKGWLADQLFAEKEFLKFQLIRYSKSYGFEVRSSSEDLKEIIQLRKRKKTGTLEAVAKLQPMEKTMILSQFASHEVAEALPPSTYLSKVGLGGRVAKWLKRVFLP